MASAFVVVTSFIFNHACLKEIKTFYYKKKGAKRVYVKSKDEFLNFGVESKDVDVGEETTDSNYR